MIPTFLSGSTRILISAGLLVPVVLIGIPAVVAVRTEREVKSSFERVSHTLEVERAVGDLVNSLLDTENGQRGFLLTHREEYLKPYEEGRGRVGQQMKELRLLTSDNPSHQERLETLQPLVRERLKFLAETIQNERSGQHEAAISLVNGDREKVMDKIAGLLRLIDHDEHRSLWIHQQTLEKHADRSKMLLWGLLGISGAFSVIVLLLLYRLSRLEPFVRMCANSRTIEYEGKWLSFEDYLHDRFGISTTHGLSPVELQKLQRSFAQTLRPKHGEKRPVRASIVA